MGAAMLIGALWLAAFPAAAQRSSDPAAAQRSADSADDATQKELARERYRAGVEAYAERRYKDAVDLFLEADELSPSAALSFNIARAYERLGDSAAALRWYRDYLRRAPDAKDADEVGEIVARLQMHLESRGVQQLTVLSEPSGATVVVDDSPVGVTPWTGELEPGSRRISLRLRGYADAERTVDLSPSRAIDVAFELAPAPPETEKTAAESTRSPRARPDPARSAPPNAARDEPGERSALLPTAGWIALGAGGATLGAAGVFELMRRSSERAAEDETVQRQAAEHLDTMESRKTAARIFAGAGAALVVTGGALLAVDLGLSSDKTRVSAGCTGGGCGLSAFGSF